MRLLDLTLASTTVWSCALLAGTAWAGADVVDLFVDGDWDGVVDGDDDDDEDACVPDRGSSRCDQDGDGVDNGLERGRGTDEFDADSDGDGVRDFDEGDDDTNGNGVIDANDICVPFGCSDADSVVVLDIPVVDGGGCAQSTSMPSLALIGLLLLAITRARPVTSAVPARVRVVRWTS